MSSLPPNGAPPANLELGSSYGVMLLSTIIAAALYGCTVLQSLYYYEQFPKDPMLLKLSVGLLWALDTLTIVMDSHALYFYLIVNFNNPPALSLEIWSFQGELLVTYTVVLIVQIFFILRLQQLRPHLWYFPLFLGIAAVVSYVLVIVIFALSVHASNFDELNQPSITKDLSANWALGMFVDFAITFGLCWYLWSEKTLVRHKTNIMLNRIIIFSVQRGAIAAVVQVMTLLAKFIWPQTLVWLAFHNALSKVYANSMLATLNARVGLRKIIMDTELDETRPPETFVTARTGRSPSRPVSKVPTMSTMHHSHRISFAPNPAHSQYQFGQNGGHLPAFDARSTQTANTLDITEYASTYAHPHTDISSFTERSTVTTHHTRKYEFEDPEGSP